MFLCHIDQIKGVLSDLRQFLATQSSLKMTEKTFYFTLKALFFLSRYLTFRLYFSVMYKNG